MSGYLERLTGNSGKRLLKELSWWLFGEFSGGGKPGDGLAAIMRRFPDFGERELFQSVWSSEPAGGEAAAGKRLAASFLAHAFVLSRSARVEDGIQGVMSGAFSSGGKTFSLKSLHGELVRQPKRGERELAAAAAKPSLGKLNALLRKKLDTITEAAQALGFGDYGELAEKTAGPGAGGEGAARGFLSDTEYASRDLLAWFLSRRMELKLPRAEEHDLAFFFNSGELKGYFGTRDMLSFSRPILDAPGIAPEGGITYDGERKPGKISDGFSVPLDPPLRAGLSIYTVGSIRDYEHFLGSLGRMLSCMFTEREDYAEFRWLRDAVVESVFDSLFRNLVHEPKWLAKYLRVDEGGDFRRLLGLRRLMSARRVAGLSIYEADLLKNSETESMPEHYGRIMSAALHCRIDVGGYLGPLTMPVRPSSVFRGAAAAPALSSYLKERFDEEWWRVPGAGEFLKGLWRDGGRMTFESLSAKTVELPRGGEYLRRVIEEEID
ncbi:MAG TPA: hypothetical protein PKC29_04070 [Thermodesulfobacteriota bacterium]|nr:hypothetical protein [Thermodesulfobacteriota bacterium]